jgi:hypothetical protein
MLKLAARLGVAVVVALLARGASAQTSKAYYRTFCSSDCTMVAQDLDWVAPDQNTQYVSMATLKLPGGSFAVTAQLDAYNSTNGSYILECALYNSTEAKLYFSDGAFILFGTSSEIVGQHSHAVLHFQMPVTFRSTGGTVGVKCRAMGHAYDNPAVPVQVTMWGGSVMAVPVGGWVLSAQ